MDNDGLEDNNLMPGSEKKMRATSQSDKKGHENSEKKANKKELQFEMFNTKDGKN